MNSRSVFIVLKQEIIVDLFLGEGGEGKDDSLRQAGAVPPFRDLPLGASRSRGRRASIRGDMSNYLGG